MKQVPFCGEKSSLHERVTLRSKNNSQKILHMKMLHSKSIRENLCEQFWTLLWILRRKFDCASSGYGLNDNNT